MPRNWGVLAFFTFHTGYELRPYELKWNMMFIFVHLCDIGNIRYLLFMRTGFVLGWRLSTEGVVAQPLHLYLFPQVWTLLVAAVLYSILWFSQMVYMYLSVEASSVELCTSLSSIYVILNKKSYVLHFIRVALYGHVSRPSVRSMSFVN